MGNAGVSSINNGQRSNSLAASTKRLNSISVISPRLICSDGISAASESTLAASCSDDISNEKKPTDPPSIDPSVPSGSNPFLRLFAMLKAILVANAVFPIEGRPAIISKSDLCKPPSFLSISVKPEGIPASPPSL